jgi:hypothetical protein
MLPKDKSTESFKLKKNNVASDVRVHSDAYQLEIIVRNLLSKCH